ncbi:DUF7507 domain-containing protein [Aquihabitans sp. McL0605]|uniref:DUF7507 domain-containing protein n=1 Tax=Aquihabitans sp. McL0605 TaxID=3415671 RepID=UPI003CF1B8F7
MAAAVAAVVIGGLAPLASSTPATDGNPDLPSVCGLDVTLVLDNSNSIDSGEQTTVRTAAQTFASALVGTPSQVKVVDFATDAEGINSAGSHSPVLNNIVFRDPALYTDPITGAGRGGTNWDDGLEVARRSNGGPGDLVVFITDGDPTYRNQTEPDGHEDDGSTATDGDGNTVDAANVTAAVYEADAIKKSGAHMFGIGVGLTGAASKQRLNDVTGDEELTLDGSGNPSIPFGTADYTIAPDFTKLQAIINAFVRDLCAPSVNVTKMLQKADGTTVQADAANPWTFGLSVTPTPTSWTSPSGASGATSSATTDSSGGVSFKWKMDANSASVDLSETAKTGWVYNGAHCTVNSLDGNAPAELFNTVGTNAANQSKDTAELKGITVGLNKAVNCDVYNRQIRSATIQVAKKTVPAGLSDTFDFTLKQGNTTIGTKTGIADGGTGTFTGVVPGTYSVTEAANAGFDQTSATCDNLGTQGVETISPLQLTVAEGQNWKCSYTNTAKPGSITVVKKSIGADGTFSFTSNVPNLGSFNLTTSGGTTSSSKVTTAVGTYNIAETNSAPWQLTSSTCTGQQSPASVKVGPGQDVVCTFTNTAPAPTINLTKTAGTSTVGEPGGPVTYTVTVANTSVEPLTITSLKDSIAGGSALDITTVNGPITATTCAPLIGKVLTVTGAGSSASCTFTAPVTGNGGTSVSDKVTAIAKDSDQNEATDNDTASVSITDVAPTLAVTKTPSVTTIAEPGGAITYTVKITNTGGEAVTIDSIKDSIEGGSAIDATVVAPPISATTCAPLLGSSLAAGANVSCTFTVATVVDKATLSDGDLDDTVTVGGHDDDNKVTATGSAEVAVTDTLPTINITKTPTPTSVAETAPGQSHPVSYLVTIQNTSPEPVKIGSITDSVEGAPASAAGGTCAALVGTTLAAGSGTSCTFTMPVSGNDGDSVHDVVSVGAADDDGNNVTDTDAAVVTITGVASSLQVTKTANVGSVPEPGGNVTYTVGIKNTSVTDSITLGSVTDSVEGGAAASIGGSCSALIGTVLAPGASTSCTFTMAVSGKPGDTVDDTVVVGGTDDDGHPVSAHGDESVDITDVPSSLQVTKTANVDSVPEPGGPVTYTVTVKNTSAADSVTITSITDSVGGGAPTAAGGTCTALIGTVLAPGASTSCTFTLTVSGNAGDAVGDTVVVNGVDDDQVPVTGTGSEIVDITDVAASISVTKTPSVPSVPEPGGNVTYTLEITNTSPADTVTFDSIVDSVSGGSPFNVTGTCDDLLGTSLAHGDSVSCTFTLLVSGNGGDSVPDTVTVNGHDDDTAPAIPAVDTSAATHTVTASASAVVDVTDVLPEGTATKKARTDTVPEPGGPVVFDVSVKNTSATESATVSHITDDVDGLTVDVTKVAGAVTDTTCATGTLLAPGATYSCHFTLLISGKDAGVTVLDEIGFTLTDDEGHSVTPSDNDTVEVADVLPTISVVKDNGDATLAAPGGDVTFNVSVTNTSTAEPVTLTDLTDTIEGGTAFDITSTSAPIVSTTCATGGVIAIGGHYDCSFTLAVNGDEAKTEADVVDATAVDDEGNPATAGDGAVTSITASADLAVDKALVGDTLTAGKPGSYTLTITNDGPSTAAAPVVVDTLPDGLTATAASGDGWACGIDGQVVTCTRALLASGEESVVTVDVTVDASVVGKDIVNVADVSSDTDDPDDSNNHDEVTTVPAQVDPDEVDVTTTTPTTAAPTAVESTETGTLPRTGSDPAPLVAFALGLVAVGGLVLFGRRVRFSNRR